MNHIENSRIRKIHELVSIVKLLSFLFCAIIIFGIYPINGNNGLILTYNDINIIMLGIICVAIIIIIYEAWIISIQKRDFYSGVRIRDVIETIIFFIIFSIMIILTGAHISQYKFLFLFIIITSTMQFGIRYGLYVAFMSSAFILTIDLITMPIDKINKNFEIDLILAGVFILTAYLLGYYVRVEKNYREKINYLANTDELTGLYNHRYFQEALIREIETSKRENRPISLLLIDIDYFKNYNDLYGHLAGDKVLNKIGEILKKLTGDIGIPARYGGEEFAIILPNTSEDTAVRIGEKIRLEVENTVFEGEENLPNEKLTISVGISSLPNKAQTKTELVNSADDALYRAKFFNKNRVERYFSVLEELKSDMESEHIELISSIKTFISIINAKDRYTYGHTERVVTYCDIMADQLKLTKEEKKILRYGAYLHDIGKIQIQKEILNKKMPLSDKEWEILKKHTEYGVEIIKHVESLQMIIPLILYHHERYDGTGYPAQLKGEEIPYLVRVLTVADSFDAMTSNRPYRDRKTYDEAIIELKKCSGSQFDPAIVEAFIDMVNAHKHQLHNYRQ